MEERIRDIREQSLEVRGGSHNLNTSSLFSGYRGVAMAWTSEKSWSRPSRAHAPLQRANPGHLLAVGLLLILGACAGPIGGPESADPGTRTSAEADPAALRPPDAEGSNRVFVVAEGETLSRIAAWLDVTVSELVTLNGLADPNALTVGQELLVPWRVASDRLPDRGPRERVPASLVAVAAAEPPPETVDDAPAAPESSRHQQTLRQLRTDLELARSAYHEADFVAALSLTQYLSAAAEALPGVPTAQRLNADASFLRGAIRVGLGDPTAARCDFGQALSITRDYRPDLGEMSPKVVAVFETVQRMGPVALSHCGSAPSVGRSEAPQLSESVPGQDLLHLSESGP